MRGATLIGCLLAWLASACSWMSSELDIRHVPPRRPPLAAEGLQGVKFGVSVADEREEPGSRELCHPSRRPPIRSQRSVRAVVGSALQRELASRSLRVVEVEQADVLFHVALKAFLCWERNESVIIGGMERPTAWAQIDAIVSLRRMPSERQLYWTTVRERAWSSRYRGSRPWNHYQDALSTALGAFAKSIVLAPEWPVRVERAVRQPQP